MKKSYITYLIFILAMTGFITLRVYAGNHTAEPAPEVSEKTDDATKEVAVSSSSQEHPVVKEEEEDLVPIPDDREYLWHGPIDPKSEPGDQQPRIVCWGDSLTVSLDGKSAFPDIIRELSGCEVINYGVESENTSMIAMREGGLRVNVKATVLPADTNLIPVFLRTENNGHVFFLDYGDAGINPCSISGIGAAKRVRG